LDKKTLVPAIFSIIALGGLGFSQESFAVPIIIEDQASCEGLAATSSWDSNTKTCNVSGVHTIPIDDGWFVPGSANDVTLHLSGTLNVEGTLSLDGGLLVNTGVVNAIGGAPRVGEGTIVLEASGINDCGGVINLIGGTDTFTGSMQLENEANFENRGVLTSSNTDIPSDNGVIRVVGSSTLINSGTIPPGIVIVQGGDFLDNQQSPCIPVGGEIIPIETTSLLLAAAQSPAWITSLTIAVLGIGAYVFTRNPSNLRNIKALLGYYLDRF